MIYSACDLDMSVKHIKDYMLRCSNPGVTDSVAGSLPSSGMVDCFWIVMVMVTVVFLPIRIISFLKK